MTLSCTTIGPLSHCLDAAMPATTNKIRGYLTKAFAHVSLGVCPNKLAGMGAEPMTPPLRAQGPTSGPPITLSMDPYASKMIRYVLYERLPAAIIGVPYTNFEFQTDPVDQQAEVQISNFKLIQWNVIGASSKERSNRLSVGRAFSNFKLIHIALLREKNQALNGDPVDEQVEVRCGFDPVDEQVEVRCGLDLVDEQVEVRCRF